MAAAYLAVWLAVLCNSLVDGQEISVTPRVGQVRLPVESNALLKCLISRESPNGPGAVAERVSWSRLMYDENVYEQLESSSSLDELVAAALPAPAAQGRPAHLSLVGGQVNRQQELRDFLDRSRQEVQQIGEQLSEATLAISPVRASDNASYFCSLAGRQARIDLVVLSRPQVRLERVQPARDSRSALVYWQVLSDGNTPIKRTLLMLKNDTWPVNRQRLASSVLVSDQDHNLWQRVDIDADGSQAPEPLETAPGGDVDVVALGQSANNRLPALARNQRAHKLHNLLPGLTYTFRLAALNDMGQSEWSQLQATMPNELPAQISEVFVLSRSNDSLALGWRRPSFDTARTIRYEMQLFDLNRTVTLDANTNSSAAGSARTNFMYIFVKLHPATDYHFHVRACSRAGCSAYSRPKLLASTLDGEPDPPEAVELSCSGGELGFGQARVTWAPPDNPRGLLLNYSVELAGQASYLDEKGRWRNHTWAGRFHTPDNRTLVVETPLEWLEPNSNYTARVCAANRSNNGTCSRFSKPETRSTCSTAVQLPGADPAVGAHFRSTGEQLALELGPALVSERNGSLACLQVVLVRLPSSFGAQSSLADFVPIRPADIRLAELDGEQAPEERALAYLADEHDLTGWRPHDSLERRPLTLGLGDGRTEKQCPRLKVGLEPRLPRDIALRPLTFYTGFLRLQLEADNRRAHHSSYLTPVQTGANVLNVPLEPFTGLHESLSQVWAGRIGLAELGRRLHQSAVPELARLYSSTASMIGLDQLTEHIRRSSPGAQLLQVAGLVLVMSLVVLLVIYLFTLPGSARRKRRRRRKQSGTDVGGQQQQQQTANLIQLANHQQHHQQHALHAPEPPAHQLQFQHQLAHHQHHPHQQPPSMPQQQVLASLEDQAHATPLKHQDASLAMERLARAAHMGERPLEPHHLPHHCATLRHHKQAAASHAHAAHTHGHAQPAPFGYNTMRMRYSDVTMYYAERFREPIPLTHFRRVLECRLRNKLLREEYDQLPLAKFTAAAATCMRLQPELVVKQQMVDNEQQAEPKSALVSGNDTVEANLITLPTCCGPGKLAAAEQTFICAKSPLDADSVWDFWRLVYEQEVSTIIMLSQVEDPSSREPRCAQYWPTCDNEETTILSPCNEFVQQSDLPPAKFKIRQETLSSGLHEEEFKIRSLTLLVMATRPDEVPHLSSGDLDEPPPSRPDEQDEQQLVLAERNILHLQYLCWNTANFRNQARLVKFIEFANKRHRAAGSEPGPMLVHCFSGLGRSGVFIAMSQIVDELRKGLGELYSVNQPVEPRNGHVQRQQLVPELNLFQLVTIIRNQRDLLISPFRFYELLYQLTANCIPSFSRDKDFAHIRLDS